ncbi:MAG: YCF48-related protein [Gammaproteobacteria bacterium]|nr:YCF48-related protein [Gammaproteobacteria bacterium]
MIIKRAFRATLFTLLLAPWSLLHAEKDFDVLAQPSVPSHIASQSLIYSLRQIGDRYFATGIQGQILYSNDGGETWEQAQTPVRSSLLSIDFPTPEQGWAAGHEGVILHSSDGGKTWEKQYDGIQYATEGLAFYQKLAGEEPDNETIPPLVEEMKLAIEQGADRPFFKVRCQSDTRCNALGAYGMTVVTFDGGKTWENNMYRNENENFNHMYDYAPLPEPGRYFIAGEAGLLLIADINERIGRRIHSVPWEGSFFSSAATADGAIVMGGLRGRMFRTADEGTTWTAVEKPATSSIIAAIRLSDDRLLAAGAAGEILVSSDNGFHFSLVPLEELGPLSSMAQGPGDTLLVGGAKGIQKITLPR